MQPGNNGVRIARLGSTMLHQASSSRCGQLTGSPINDLLQNKVDRTSTNLEPRVYMSGNSRLQL